MHLHRLRARLQTGDLGVEQQRAALVGLDLEGQGVRGEVKLLRAGEERAGRTFELDGDLGDAPGQALART